MCASRAALHHLQALQAPRAGGPVLDVAFTPGCMGAGFAEEGLAHLGLKESSELRPAGLFDGCDEAGPERLREMVHMATFWISLLEGEHHDLREEVSKHKQRHHEVRRQAEAKASVLRECEAEKKQLQQQLKLLQQSRDEAICDRAVLRQDGNKVKGDADTIASRVETLEEERDRDREEKAELEVQLVKTKMRYAETLQRAEFYEDQLRALNPAFEVFDPSRVGSWMPRHHQLPAADVEVESNHSQNSVKHPETEDKDEKEEKAHKVKKGLKGGLSKMRSFLKVVKKKDGDETGEAAGVSRRSSVGSVSGSKLAVPAAVSGDCQAGDSEASESPRPKSRWEMRMEA